MIQFILEGKFILKKMVHKIISANVQMLSKGLQVLVLVNMFIYENLKDCLMKILQPLLQVIIASINPQLSYVGNKTRVEFKERCFKQD